MGYVYHLPSKVSHQNIGCPCGAQPPGCPSPNSTRVDIWEDVQSFLRHSRAYLGRPFSQAPLKTLCMYATPAQTNVLPAQPSPALTSGHARPASSWPRTQPRAATTWRKIPSSTGPGNLDSRNPWPHPAPPSPHQPCPAVTTIKSGMYLSFCFPVPRTLPTGFLSHQVGSPSRNFHRTNPCWDRGGCLTW